MPRGVLHPLLRGAALAQPRAGGGDLRPRARKRAALVTRPALADDATLRELKASTIAGLIAAGLLRNETANRDDVDALMASLQRGSLTAGEASQWLAAFRARSA